MKISGSLQIDRDNKIYSLVIAEIEGASGFTGGALLEIDYVDGSWRFDFLYLMGAYRIVSSWLKGE